MENKKLTRRDFLRASALTAAGVVAAACVVPASQVPAAIEEVVAATPAATATVPGTPIATLAPGANPTTMTFWNMPFMTQEVSPSFVQEFEAAAAKDMPNIKLQNSFGPGDYGVLRQKYLLQAKTGTPDVIEGLLGDEAVYVKDGLIEALDDLFMAWPDHTEFVPATLEALKINGKLWGIPYNTNARGMVHRTDVLEKYKIDLPKTWPELLDAARKITQDSNKQMYGFMCCTSVNGPRAPQEFISWYYQVSNGKHMWDVSSGSAKLMATADQFETILNLYKELFSGNYPAVDPAQRGAGWQVEDPGYAEGKWAMAPEGPWLWGRTTSGATPKNILENLTEITELPIPQGGGHYTYLEVKPIMMNTYTKHKDLAWELVKFITSKEQMGLWLASSGGIPARKDSLTISAFQGPINKWETGWAKLLPQGVGLAPINWGPVYEAYMKSTNTVIYGTATPKAAAEQLYTTLKGMESSVSL
jgi:ABC-type glycerol-3-phosphate transport system substrate-binding protein